MTTKTTYLVNSEWWWNSVISGGGKTIIRSFWVFRDALGQSMLHKVLGGRSTTKRSSRKDPVEQHLLGNHEARSLDPSIRETNKPGRHISAHCVISQLPCLTGGDKQLSGAWWFWASMRKCKSRFREMPKRNRQKLIEKCTQELFWPGNTGTHLYMHMPI